MVLSPMNPWSWNGITGWYGCLLGMQLQLPFGVCVAVALAGFVFSAVEVFRKKIVMKTGGSKTGIGGVFREQRKAKHRLRTLRKSPGPVFFLSVCYQGEERRIL